MPTSSPSDAPSSVSAAPSPVDLDPALRYAWDHRLRMTWFEQHRETSPVLVDLLNHLPKPSLFNRRQSEVQALIDTLLSLDLPLEVYHVYPNIHKDVGWNYRHMVQVADHDLYVGEQFDDQQRYRLSPTQRARFEDMGQRWQARWAEHMAQRPTPEQLDAMAEHQALQQEMSRTPSTRRARRGGSDDLSSWTTASSPLPNVYNGYRGMGD